jgi:hypothetical protein
MAIDRRACQSRALRGLIGRRQGSRERRGQHSGPRVFLRWGTMPGVDRRAGASPRVLLPIVDTRTDEHKRLVRTVAGAPVPLSPLQTTPRPAIPRCTTSSASRDRPAKRHHPARLLAPSSQASTSPRSNPAHSGPTSRTGWRPNAPTHEPTTRARRAGPRSPVRRGGARYPFSTFGRMTTPISRAVSTVLQAARPQSIRRERRCIGCAA